MLLQTISGPTSVITSHRHTGRCNLCALQWRFLTERKRAAVKTQILTEVMFCLSACVPGTAGGLHVGLQISPCTRSFPGGGELLDSKEDQTCAGETNWDANKVLSNLLWPTQLEQGVGWEGLQRSLPTTAVLWLCDKDSPWGASGLGLSLAKLQGSSCGEMGSHCSGKIWAWTGSQWEGHGSGQSLPTAACHSY